MLKKAMVMLTLSVLLASVIGLADAAVIRVHVVDSTKDIDTNAPKDTHLRVGNERSHPES